MIYLMFFLVSVGIGAYVAYRILATKKAAATPSTQQPTVEYVEVPAPSVTPVAPTSPQV